MALFICLHVLLGWRITYMVGFNGNPDYHVGLYNPMPLSSGNMLFFLENQ